jgi:16S rRNA (guanine966-N2)-methyltransferase
VRVIAGRWGGRRLQAPPGEGTRPTSDRVREALFSVLGARVQGARVLDLFAGSGALGIEALSRGAAEATFVDSAPASIRVVRANLEALGGEAEVRRADARRFLGSASAAARQYDLVFLDPPYRLAGHLERELTAALPAVLAPGAAVVAESDRRAPLELGLPLLDERRYGDTLIRIHAT